MIFARTAIICAALGFWSLAVPCSGDEPGFSLIAKAQPDEFYHGLGGEYFPLGSQPPDLEGQPKVNQSYVWSMVRSGDNVWFGTAANPVAAALGGIVSVPIPNETLYNVYEYRKSQFPGVPPVLKLFLGDWRPPQIFRLNAGGRLIDATPDHPLINQTLGMRSSGANNGVVLIGGPDLSQIGINLFAFDGTTGDFLGAEHFTEFSDIRRWVNVDGHLYTATLNTWTLSGAGSVLRWRGSRQAPFEYEIVGKLDNEGATLCAHDGRLFACTWSTLSQTIETVTGARSQQPSGVWMSPPVPGHGLTASDADDWTKVWSADEYEPDPVIVRSLWMGAAASHDGHLIWGTIQIPGYGAQVLKEVYGLPGDPRQVLTAIRNSFRPATLFRGRLDQRGQFQAELLYGDRRLPVYTKTGDHGRWTPQPNGMGPAMLGEAGFGDRFNMYVWSMLPHHNRLWIGTFDMSFVLLGNDYVTGTVRRNFLGGDLLVLDGTDQPATFISRTGCGNVVNNGIRDMLADGDQILLGTATSANLLTNPEDDLMEGGWEVKRFDPAAADPFEPTPRTPADPDWMQVWRVLGQSPP